MGEHYRDLRELVEKIEKTYSDEVVFKSKDKGEIVEIKYSKFVEDIKALGAYFLSLDLKNKRIAVISNNRYEWCVAYLAAATSDLILVPIDRALPENEFHSLIERSEAEVIVYESKYDNFINVEKEKKDSSLRWFINMDSDMGKCYKDGKALLKRKNSPYYKVKIANDKMRFMLFTSGTTSMSKCVMLSHKNICTNIEQIDNRLDVNKNDTLLSFLPIHHTFECTAGFLYAISKGAKIAFCEGLRYFAQNIKDFGVTAMISVPLLYENIYNKILKTIKDTNKEKQVEFALKASRILLKIGIDIRKVAFKQIHDNIGEKTRFFVSGAAAMKPEVIKGFNDFGIPMYQGYGLTETSPVISVENATNSKYGSVGKPLDNIEVKIDNPNEDGIGEIIVKSPTVMLGYYNNEEETKKVLSNGWFKTGDLGRVDEEGYIFITGRKKDVIVLRNGKNIFPEELESIITNIEYIKEALVYGAPIGENDVELRAKLVYDKDFVKNKYGDISIDELKGIVWKEIKEINKTMPTYKYIKSIIITDEEMIKTTTKKIKRHAEIAKVLQK